MNDVEGGLIESATFCKPNDSKRPTIVGLPDFTTTQVCSDDGALGADKVMDAVPTTWFVRVMFDELLDPNVEELIPVINPETNMPDGTFDGSLANTQPVVLTCGGTVVAYDGYYSPSGNNVTWPLGPSLFIQPEDLSVVATGAECTLQIKETVKDKNGELVPTDQRTGFSWNIAALELTATSPAPAEAAGEEEEITPDSPLVLTFNAFVDAASLGTGEFTIKEGPLAADGSADCAGATTIRTAEVPAADGIDSIDLQITGGAVACPGAMAGDPPVACAWNPMRTYVVEFNAGAEVTDVAATPGTAALPGAADFSLCFITSAP